MATYDTPIPNSPEYLQAAALAKQAYGNALTRINQKRQGYLRQSGYQADVDPTSGSLTNLRVDSNNPYGEYQTIRRNHADQLEGLEGQLAERGLRGGGLAAQTTGRARLDLGRDDYNLGNAMVGSLSGYQDEQNQAKYTMDNALYQAELEAARQAIAERMFNQADFTGVDYTKYGEDPIKNTPDSVPDSTPDAAKPYTLTGTAATILSKLGDRKVPQINLSNITPGIGIGAAAKIRAAMAPKPAPKPKPKAKAKPKPKKKGGK